ncbi:tyramine/octopamine receptor-like isoform X1 [Culex pipiens pallens]|uniref:tyramine/octopamine receptor-like isoform X1 n=1 Tax=Culex pipiens pallens TaxID=42434 RepID=UPI0022AADDE2|nr:tyramine/octopamine receptor-like isoform X1 [Culex pipiens pallens]XP_052562891.1 tyramine/octopamine receptor-like isoform X1 [Culex pipiens pallens]
MTNDSFVYGVELKSPPPTTADDQLTQYDRFLKTQSMSEQFLNQFPGRQYRVSPSDQSVSLVYLDDQSHDSVNLSTSIRQILRQNIISTEWSLREGSTAATAANETSSGPGGSGSGSTGAVSRAHGDSTFQNNLIIPLYAVIFLLSVIGNLLVILTLAQNKRMRTVTNVYLLNLAISDLLLGVFCMPFTLVGQVLRKFIFGSIMCKLIPYFQAVSVSVAVWTLVAISLERYFAICRPLTSRRWQTQFHAYKMIAVVWALSFLVNSPLCYVQRLQPVGQRGGTANITSIIVVDPPMKCREMWPDKSYERAYVLFLDTGLLILPLLTMGFAYSMIVSKLWRGLRREMKNSVFQRHQLQINNAATVSLATSALDNVAAAAATTTTGSSRGQLITARSEATCYLLAAPGMTNSNSTSHFRQRAQLSLANNGNNNHCPYSTTAAAYGGMFQHHRGLGGGAGGGQNGPSSVISAKGNRLQMLKDFVESRRQRRPKSALKTTPIVPTVSSLTAAGLSASNSPKRIPLMPSASASGSKSYNSVTYSYATLETALNDRASSTEGGGVPTMLDPTSSMAPMGTSTSIPMTTTTTTKANLGPAILDSAYNAAATSFSRQAIRSTYMDKSIEAKKKVIRMLFVIIVEFFVCWAPLHILNTVYLYSPTFVYTYVSSNGIALVQLMAYISSCCNPITYCFMNRRFRQAFLNIFGCYQHRIFLCLCCCFHIPAESTQADAESKSGQGSRGANRSNNQGGGAGPGAGGNNSDISGNDSMAYAGRSIVQRSEIVVLESEDRV